MALPTLKASDLYPIGRGKAEPNANRVVIGPSTSLGVSGLLPSPRTAYTAITGEGGHTLGAKGGVYIGAGILPHLLPELENSIFRERFECKGRFRHYRQNIPTFVINTKDSPDFIGTGKALNLALA